MHILAVSIDLNKIDKSRIVAGKDGAKYYDMSVILNDEPDQYGKDVAVTQGQTKEEREAKAKRVYIGNGKTVYRKAAETTTSKPQNNDNYASSASGSDDLPFIWILVPLFITLSGLVG